MGRKLRDTSGRAKNAIETDDDGHRKPRGSRAHQLKAVPQRRALPKDKTSSKRRQHSGGEATRHSRKEIAEGRISMSGRGRSGAMPKNNVGSKGKGTQVGRRRVNRATKISAQARR